MYNALNKYYFDIRERREQNKQRGNKLAAGSLTNCPLCVTPSRCLMITAQTQQSLSLMYRNTTLSAPGWQIPRLGTGIT